MSKFTDKQKKDLKEKMPEETYAYFNAIMNNIQGYEMSNTTSGLRIDETIFTQNAFDFLIEAKTKEDILNFFDKIKTDSVFNGSSKIEDFVVNVGGIFGNQNLTIKNDGSFDLNIDETITKSLSSFTSSLPSSLSGAIPNFSTILQSMDPSIANGIKDVIGIVTAFTNSRKEA